MPYSSFDRDIDGEKDNYNILEFAGMDKILVNYGTKMGTIFPYCRDKLGRYAYTHFTYEQMNEESNRYAWGLVERGIKPGSKVLLLFPPSLEFTLIFATLFKIGAIPILIDPGMGIRPMLKSIQSVEPDAFIGIPKAQLARIFGRRYFKSVKLSITVGRRWFWRGPRLDQLRSDNSEQYPLYVNKRDDKAGIFFTTGSTGIPKGVIYTHIMFHTLMATVADFFHLEEEAIDMPAFPPFALFCMAYGGTSVIPEMDPTEPSKADPKRLIQSIQDFGVTVSYGSPSIWGKVSKYCVENNITLPSMSRIIMFGAPVPGRILEEYSHVLPNGMTYTPYGSTEALFVCNITGKEVLEETWELSKQGKGTCVGYVVEGINLRIIKVIDEPITIPEGKSIEDFALPKGSIGEITVNGPYVTREYYNMPEKTKEGKIYDGDVLWHRMGDLGYVDEKERLWVVGRKSHRITRDGKDYYTLINEAPFRNLDGVLRCAMVGVPCPKMGQRMVIILQLDKKNIPKSLKSKKNRLQVLNSLAKEKNIPVDAFLIFKKIPVDIRHNAKIKRNLLAITAAKKLKGRFEA